MKALLRKFGLAGFDPAADALYRAAVHEGRRALYYLDWPENARVPDTVDGRFDMISLMVTLLSRRIAACDPAQAKRANAVSQDLFDLFFADMDINLREMGVSDEGMKYKIKPMASAHMGRAKAYTACLDGAEDGASPIECLAQAFARNIYRTAEAPDGEPLALRAVQLAAHLAKIPDVDILAGQVDFPEPSAD